MKRVLIDQGSSAKVVYYSLFKELKIPETDLSPPEVPLIGFSGIVVTSIGFIVIDAPSPYNAIFERNWLHALKAMHSLNLPPGGTVYWGRRQTGGLVRRPGASQAMLQQLGRVPSIKRVHWVEVLGKPVLEDVSSLVEQKSIEDLVKVPFNEDRSSFFMLGFSLMETKREEMVQFLKDNIEVFAWTP